MATKVVSDERRMDDPKASSREVLLASACALMTERSTIEISLSDIAKHSGLNSALVKYYFGTKQGMMLALVEDVLSKGLDRLEDLVAMDMSATEKLKLHVKAIITIYFRFPFINRLIHYLFADPVAGLEVAEKISKPLAETQRHLLEQGIATGEFKPVDPMMFYFIILGACDHLFFGQHIMRVAFHIETIDDAMRRRYTKTLLDMVLSGILTDEDKAG
jgi:AcrR family transcriptional regulator